MIQVFPGRGASERLSFMEAKSKQLKVVVAVHGSRGDVEPCLAAAIELRRRGHEVQMAVPPQLDRLCQGQWLYHGRGLRAGFPAADAV